MARATEDEEREATMKIFSCYSDSHIVFLGKHFLPSVHPDNHVELVHMEQDCSGVYTDDKWGKMAERMLRLKGQAILAKAGTPPFYVSDVDARFYGDVNVSVDMMQELGSPDLLMQDDGEGGLCSGSFVVVPCPRVAEVFFDAIKLLPKHNGHDQPALNEALANHSDVKAVKLPPSYWSHGAATGKKWELGMEVYPPADIVVHQANWCVGIENKLALLDQVKGIVEARRCA
jgi:hypothetical protein